MPRAPKRRRYMLEEDLQAQMEKQALIDAQVSIAVDEEDTSSSSSTCSSSFPSSSSSTSSSCYPLLSSSPEDDFGYDELLSPSQSPLTASSSHTATTSTPCSQSDVSSQGEEGPSTSQSLTVSKSLSRSEIDEKVNDLVEFLLLKYRMKELTTKAEMLNSVIKNYQEHFPVIFSEASECMQLVFGIDLKEVDPSSHSYVLVTTLGLTYDGMLSEVQGMPKAGLLVLILSIIFMEGNCASEEVVWETLSVMGVCAGREHFIYGDPRKLITHDWVQEEYLVYRQVPNSDPAHYEFLWGPRAHNETSKMSLLEFLAKVNGSDPRAFQVWYEEALRDEEEKAQARVATTDDATTPARASLSASSSSLCPK
ncbi:melanoma-associated antigen 10-like [Urocitellus parryii]|uniref:melanoma-associated antigen 10-like n=1 Tax=Urocitellus parryii TaxID=9999 RepID=UPI000E55F8D3|nr:melanoma-associated antigen 10-like [Urocitellus parryii]